MGNWTLLWRVTDILLKGLLSDKDQRMLLLQWGFSSLGFCSVSSNNFFVFRYTFLSLVLTIDFCNSQLIFFLYISYLKKTQSKKRLNILQKMNSLKKVEGVSLLNFEGVPGLGYRGPASQGTEVPGPEVLVPFLHHAIKYAPTARMI